MWCVMRSAVSKQKDWNVPVSQVQGLPLQKINDIKRQSEKNKK